MAFFKSIRNALAKTRSIFTGSFDFLRGKKELDESTQEQLETILLKADFGIETTEALLAKIAKRANKENEEVFTALKQELKAMLTPSAKVFELNATEKPKLILMVGVNGAGKTTSIGKLANFLKQKKYSLVLAAGDTFRAAAINQLNVWGERNHIPVVSQNHGSDSASVIFDALQSAQSKGINVVIADTAGRLQNKQHLMEELRKILRVMKKLDEAAPHELILVLDAGIGQNALKQVKEFNEIAPLTGIILTKLDGTAKGGIVFTISDQYKLPIYFLGTGEGIEDFRPFDADEFVEGLFAE